jgi:hypothetical protein
MTTEIKTFKFNCSCGFGTDDRKAHMRHFRGVEKELHKSIKVEVVKNEVVSPPPEVAKVETQAKVITESEAILGNNPPIQWKPPRIELKPKKGKHGKLPAPVLTECIVIDADNNWHEHEKIDLKGRDMADCTWGSYGHRYPVLVEKNGVLLPYIPSDDAKAESPHMLFIAAKSFGYKGYMRIDSDLLKKIAIGIMALVAFGTLFLIYLLANQKPAVQNNIIVPTQTPGIEIPTTPILPNE